jgi:hypothetical protein
MFHKILFTIILSVSTFISHAAEQLDILVVYDQYTIYGINNLNSPNEQVLFTRKLIKRLEKTFKNSYLDDNITFNLKKMYLKGFSRTNENDTQDIFSIHDDYLNHWKSIKKTGKTSGVLYKLQEQFNADIVIAIFNPGVGAKNCGIAVNVPSSDDIGGKLTNNNLLQSFAGNGLFFLSANKGCQENEITVSHELGHTFGLNHSREMNTKAFDKYIKPFMLDSRASGYVNKSYNFQTAMSYVSGIYRNNVFSDKYNFACSDYNQNYGLNYPCGDTSHYSTKIIEKYASDYNKRAGWYK